LLNCSYVGDQLNSQTTDNNKTLTAAKALPGQLKLLCFRLGKTVFGIDIMRIKEIVPLQKLSEIPSPASFIDGVINLRGAVIPVMNMRKRFGMSASAGTEEAALIILKLHRQLLAITVDEVLEVVAADCGDIMPPPDMEDGLGVECVIGVCLSRGRVLMILGIDFLLGDDEQFKACLNQLER